MRHRVFAGTMAFVFVAGLAVINPVALDARQAGGGSAASGEMTLGNVRVTRNVTADGKPLKAGTYRLRLTADNATPVPAGQTAQLERWVEFLQGSKVVAREVVSIVPQDEIAQVAQDKPPASGGSRVDLLKGNDYLRIWVNRGGNHYLIHLPTGMTG